MVVRRVIVCKRCGAMSSLSPTNHVKGAAARATTIQQRVFGPSLKASLVHGAARCTGKFFVVPRPKWPFSN